ncbi:MAG: GerMN domain-containing protein [Firmicutes bacterium]|nr:GerMN domain-containing protein [Bacillota bacterium]
MVKRPSGFATKSLALILFTILAFLPLLPIGGCLRRPTTPSPEGQPQATVKIYFYSPNKAPNKDQIKLVPVNRPITKPAGSADGLRLAFEELLKGPTAPEAKSGHYSAIPPNTRLRSARIENNVAVLDFNRQIERTGGTAAVSAMLDQIAYTATEQPGIKKVRLLVEGEQAGTRQHPFTGDGFLFEYLAR